MDSIALLRVSAYEVYDPENPREILACAKLRHADKNHWAAYSGDGTLVITEGLDLEYEPMPSSRTDEFIERTRCSEDEAKRRALDYSQEKRRRADRGGGK